MPVGLTDEPRVGQRVRRAKSRCAQTRTLVSIAIEADPVAGALTQRQPQAFSISALSVEISRQVRGTSGYFPGRGALLAVEAALPAPQLATRIVRVIHAAPRADGAPRRIRRSSLRSQPKLELHGGAHQQHGQKAGGITSWSCARPHCPATTDSAWRRDASTQEGWLGTNFAHPAGRRVCGPTRAGLRPCRRDTGPGQAPAASSASRAPRQQAGSTPG